VHPELRFDYIKMGVRVVHRHIFLDPHRLDGEDTRRDYNEKRWLTLGKKPRELTPAEAQRLDATPIDYSDIPPLGDEFFMKATAAWPPAKHQLTIRLDEDVLNWLKANGRGYQTRINRILRAAMESRPARSSRSTSGQPKPLR
jgi:uncharacterized protein (DUF4415 family)